MIADLLIKIKNNNTKLIALFSQLNLRIYKLINRYIICIMNNECVICDGWCCFFDTKSGILRSILES